MSDPGPSKVPKQEIPDEVEKFYGDMTDAVLVVHTKALMCEVTRRNSQNHNGAPLLALAAPPQLTSQDTEELPRVRLIDPKHEYTDEQYLVVHERASGVEYHPETSSYTWNPRLMDTDGIRRTNELNNYGRPLLQNQQKTDPPPPPPPVPSSSSSGTKTRNKRAPAAAKTKTTTITTSKTNNTGKKAEDPVVDCSCSICNARFNSLRVLLEHRQGGCYGRVARVEFGAGPTLLQTTAEGDAEKISLRLFSGRRKFLCVSSAVVCKFAGPASPPFRFCSASVATGDFLEHRGEKHSLQDMLTCHFCERRFPSRNIFVHLCQEYKVFQCPVCLYCYASDWHRDHHRCEGRPVVPVVPTVPAVKVPVPPMEVKEELVDPEYDEHEQPEKKKAPPVVQNCGKCGKKYTSPWWFERHEDMCTGPLAPPPPSKTVGLKLKCEICLRVYSCLYWFGRHKETCNSDTPTPAVVLPSKATPSAAKDAPPPNGVRCKNCDKKFQHEISLGYHARYCSTKVILPSLMPKLKNNTVEMEEEEEEEEMTVVAPNSREEKMEEEDEDEDEEEDDNSGLKLKIQCSICKLEFPGVSNLLSHRKNHHGMTAMLTCGICDKNCGSLSSIRRHISQEYEIYRCKKCGRNCQDSTTLLAHDCSKPYTIRDPHLSRLQHGAALKCSSCHASFTTSTLLYNHRMTCELLQQHAKRHSPVTKRTVSVNRLPSVGGSRPGTRSASRSTAGSKDSVPSGCIVVKMTGATSGSATKSMAGSTSRSSSATSGSTIKSMAGATSGSSSAATGSAIKSTAVVTSGSATKSTAGASSGSLSTATGSATKSTAGATSGSATKSVAGATPGSAASASGSTIKPTTGANSGSAVSAIGSTTKSTAGVTSGSATKSMAGANSGSSSAATGSATKSMASVTSGSIIRSTVGVTPESVVKPIASATSGKNPGSSAGATSGIKVPSKAGVTGSTVRFFECKTPGSIVVSPAYFKKKSISGATYGATFSGTPASISGATSGSLLRVGTTSTSNSGANGSKVCSTSAPNSKVAASTADAISGVTSASTSSATGSMTGPITGSLLRSIIGSTSPSNFASTSGATPGSMPSSMADATASTVTSRTTSESMDPGPAPPTPPRTLKRTRAQSVHTPRQQADPNLKCSECAHQSVTLSELALHRQTIHRKPPHSCNFCPRVFRTQRALYDHHMTEIGRWKCSKCNKVVNRKYLLHFHERYCGKKAEPPK